MADSQTLDFIWTLLRTGGPLDLAALVHELTVLRRTGAAGEIPRPTRDAVTDWLCQLREANRVAQSSDGTWRVCYPNQVLRQQRQGVLFS